MPVVRFRNTRKAKLAYGYGNIMVTPDLILEQGYGMWQQLEFL